MRMQTHMAHARVFLPSPSATTDAHVHAPLTERSVCHSNELLASNQRVLVVEASGLVRPLNWSAVYGAMRDAAGIPADGYLTHEAVLWSDAVDAFIALPRRASHTPFDELEDQHRGANLLLVHSGKEGSAARLVHVQGESEATRGFSAVKLLPGTADELVAIKTEELGQRTASFLTVLRTDGTVLMPETHISLTKFEGLEVAV